MGTVLNKKHSKKNKNFFTMSAPDEWIKASSIIDNGDDVDSFSQCSSIIHELINYVPMNNASPLLHQALKSPNITRWLLDNGADPNLKTHFIKDTPLIHAMDLRKKYTAVPTLLKYGADPNIHNIFNMTPLSVASKCC
jgi:ankyrin repeat protein